MRNIKQGFVVSLALALLMSVANVSIARDNNTLYPIVKNKLWGYINSSGKIVVEPKYANASVFADGRGMVKTPKPEKKIYCIDVKGNIVFEVPANLAGMKPFSNGLARVKNKETKLYGYVDLTGKLVIPYKYKSAAAFSEGLAKVEFKDSQDNSMRGFINTKGEMAIQPDKWLKNSFSDGLASIRTEKDGKFVYGFMNTKGKIVIEPRFKKVGKFGQGLAFVNDNGKIQIIDKQGKPTVTFDFKVGSFDRMPKFSHGFANLYYDWKFPKGFWGFVDKKGKLAFPKLNIRVVKTPFSEDRAWIKLRGSNDMVLIDTDGKIYAQIANVKDATEFKDGLSAVILKKEKNIYYYNHDGKQVWK